MKLGRRAPISGADDEAHQQIELGVAIERGIAGDAVARGAAASSRSIGAVRVDSRVALERGRVAQPFGRREFALRRSTWPPALDLAHQRGIVEIQPIPFDQREFRVVPAAALAVAKHLADLVDIAAARGQQPLHRMFRRRSEIERPRRPRPAVVSDSICGSVTPAPLKIGVSTSSTPRSAKNPRARASIAAACAQRADAPLGRHVLIARILPIDWPRRSPPAAQQRAQATRSRSNSKITVDPMLKRPSSAPFSSLRSVGARRVTCAPRRGRDVAGPDGRHAADVERADEHHANCPAAPSNSVSTRSLRANSRGTWRAVAALTLNSRPGT
jgi:hypothetical protein